MPIATRTVSVPQEFQKEFWVELDLGPVRLSRLSIFRFALRHADGSTVREWDYSRRRMIQIHPRHVSCQVYIYLGKVWVRIRPQYFPLSETCCIKDKFQLHIRGYSSEIAKVPSISWRSTEFNVVDYPERIQHHLKLGGNLTYLEAEVIYGPPTGTIWDGETLPKEAPVEPRVPAPPKITPEEILRADFLTTSVEADRSERPERPDFCSPLLAPSEPSARLLSELASEHIDLRCVDLAHVDLAHVDLAHVDFELAVGQKRTRTTDLEGPEACRVRFDFD